MRDIRDSWNNKQNLMKFVNKPFTGERVNLINPDAAGDDCSLIYDDRVMDLATGVIKQINLSFQKKNSSEGFQLRI